MRQGTQYNPECAMEGNTESAEYRRGVVAGIEKAIAMVKRTPCYSNDFWIGKLCDLRDREKRDGLSG